LIHITYLARQSFRLVNTVDAEASNLIPDSINDVADSIGVEYHT
jgi:hypothetical protein